MYNFIRNYSPKMTNPIEEERVPAAEATIIAEVVRLTWGKQELIERVIEALEYVDGAEQKKKIRAELSKLRATKTAW